MKSFRKVKLCWEVKLKRSESVHDFRFQMKVCKGKKVLLFIQFGRFWAKILPEAHRTQAIESKTWIISADETKKNQFSALLAVVHPLLTTFPTLYTSLPSYSSTTISMTTINSKLPYHDISASSASIDYWVGIIISQNHISNALLTDWLTVWLKHCNVSIKQSVTQIETPGPIDQTLDTPESGKKWNYGSVS